MNHPDITPGYYRIDGVDLDGEGRSYVLVTTSGTVWGLSVYDDGDGEGPTAEYRTMGWRLIDGLAVWPPAQWHPDHDRRAEVQAEHDARPGDYILVVEPVTMARAQALGFEPGTDDVLAWALAEVERLRLEAEEMRLELAAEQGRQEGAPSEGWECDSGWDHLEWAKESAALGTVTVVRQRDGTADWVSDTREAGNATGLRAAMKAADEAEARTATVEPTP